MLIFQGVGFVFRKPPGTGTPIGSNHYSASEARRSSQTQLLKIPPKYDHEDLSMGPKTQELGLYLYS